jgi:hypothetical protein
MPPSLNGSLGLHCLLHLVPDRICEPETAHPDGSIADVLRASEHRLARVAGSAIKAFMWDPPTAPDDLRVFVPCRPTLAVLKKELGPRLLMAALLECRDLGMVELRLGEEHSWNRGRVQVVPLVTSDLGGLCGEIIKRLTRKGEQDIEKLFTGMMGNKPTITIGGLANERWVIDKVESELADRGCMRPTVMVRRWPPGRKVQAVVDCDQIHNLAEDCTLAVDRWNRAWAADVSLCHALLANCTEAMEPKGGGG